MGRGLVGSGPGPESRNSLEEMGLPGPGAWPRVRETDKGAWSRLGGRGLNAGCERVSEPPIPGRGPEPQPEPDTASRRSAGAATQLLLAVRQVTSCLLSAWEARRRFLPSP